MSFLSVNSHNKQKSSEILFILISKKQTEAESAVIQTVHSVLCILPSKTDFRWNKNKNRFTRKSKRSNKQLFFNAFWLLTESKKINKLQTNDDSGTQ